MSAPVVGRIDSLGWAYCVYCHPIEPHQTWGQQVRAGDDQAGDLCRVCMRPLDRHEERHGD